MDYIGKLLGGRYEIIDVVGVGGMAVVYRARCHVLNRYVAVKILKEEYARDPDIRKRFSIESQAVAKLSHHNIVSVYDVGQDNGTDYIVMELIEGITLKEYLKEKGKFTWMEMVYFSSQIARALMHAHSRGIIHQDVKPQNVIILRDGTAKLTDFGIASFATQETRVAQEAIGSVHYISPEQAKGQPIDYRADIYSLGVVMYEMVTGKMPYDGDTAVQVVMQHVQAKAKLPSALVEDLPKGIDQIVMHAMCPHVKQRYETAEQLSDDLEAMKKNPAMTFPYACGVASGSEAPRTAPKTAPKTAPRTRTASGANETPARREARGESRTRTRARDEDEREQSFLEKIGERPGLAAGLAVGIVVIITLFVVGALLLTGDSGDKIQVPQFVGSMIDDVLESEDAANFDLQEASVRVADTAPAGQIIKQSVDAERKVKKGTRIVLTVSSGESTDTDDDSTESLTLKDYSGQTRAYLEGLLSKYKISISEQIEEYSDTIEKGKIIKTVPGKGETVEHGGTITIYVSKGSDTASVPQVTGESESNAKNALYALGFEVKVVSQESSKAAGTVLAQNPNSGEKVAIGSTVTITVSTGPAAVEPPVDNTQDPNNSTGDANHSGDPENTPGTGDTTVNGTQPSDGGNGATQDAVSVDAEGSADS